VTDAFRRARSGAVRGQDPRGLIFDLFHTLTGKESEWSDLPWTSDVLGVDRRLWDELLTARSRWRLAGEERDPLKILTLLAREADPSISDERIRDAVRVRVQRFRDALQRVPLENVETLKSLRAAGLRLGLISNADVMEVAAWHDCPLAGLFDAEVFSCEVGHVKPEPAIYEHCLRQLGVLAGDCWFVGDGGSNELVGARDAGLKTVFVSGVIAELWPERVPLRMPHGDYHIERVPQILELLRS
jgi:putative hydrolase of the HAD superfamily